MGHITRFIIGILAFYILFVSLLYLIPLESIVVWMAGTLLDAKVSGTQIFFGEHVFEIADLCSGRLELALVLAFVLATPDRKWKTKILGSLFAVPFIFFFNIIRIVMVIRAVGEDIVFGAFLHDVSFRIFLFISLVGYYFLWYLISYKLGRGISVWIFSKLVMVVFLFLLFSFMLVLLDMVQTRSYMWQSEALIMRIADHVFDTMYSESINVTSYIFLPVRLPETYVLDPKKKDFGIQYVLEIEEMGNRLNFLVKDKIRDRYLAGYSLNITGFHVDVKTSEVDPEEKQKLVIKKIEDKLIIGACRFDEDVYTCV